MLCALRLFYDFEDGLGEGALCIDIFEGFVLTVWVFLTVAV